MSWFLFSMNITACREYNYRTSVYLTSSLKQNMIFFEKFPRMYCWINFPSAAVASCTVLQGRRAFPNAEIDRLTLRWRYRRRQRYPARRAEIGNNRPDGAPLGKWVEYTLKFLLLFIVVSRRDVTLFPNYPSCEPQVPQFATKCQISSQINIAE